MEETRNDILKSGIYAIKNSINEKFYIGSSNNVKGRYSSHLYKLEKRIHTNRKLQYFVNKYGLDSLFFEVIELCPSEILNQREQHYIDTLKPSFNIRVVVESNRGTKWSDESKLKIRGRKIIWTNEMRAKVSMANKGQTRSTEQKRKLSEAKKGFVFTPEHKEKLRLSHLGIGFSDEHKVAMRGRVHSLEERNKRSLALKGRPRSQEVKDKIKASWILRKKNK